MCIYTRLQLSRWKIDRRLIPLLGLLGALEFTDRANLGVARIVGMDRDLVSASCSTSGVDMLTAFQHLNIGTRYSVLSLVYFVPYLMLQVPHVYALDLFLDLVLGNCRPIYS